jgi:hypothetical protein
MAQRKSKRNKGFLKKGSSKGWRRAALGGAAMAMAMANTIYVPPAYAVCPGTISGSSTAACTMTGADSLIITSTGKLDLSGKSTTAVYVDSLGNGATINNSGLIDGGYYNAISVQIGALNTTITNGTGASIAALGTTAVSLGGDLDGSLTNSGTIASGSSSYSTYDARAILIGGDLSGTLTNNSSGTISAVAANSGSYADAYGIEINGDLTGSLINHGTISASASVSASTWTTASATAYGVQAGNVSGSLTNTGTISAVATAVQQYSSDASAEAYGVAMGDLTATGTLDNSGTISAHAIASNLNSCYSADASAWGIAMSALDGTLINSGTISAEADAFVSGSSPAEAYARGMAMGDLNGTLTNTSTGSITATANATGVSSGEAYAYAYGVDMGELYGTLTNAGTISAVATAVQNYSDTAGADAYGISMYDLTDTGTLDNSGTISAHAIASAFSNFSWYSADASAWGVQMSNLYGKLTNSGTISAEADALNTDASAYAYAYGIQLSNLYGSLTNTSTGTIAALADGTVSSGSSYAYADAYGVNMEGQLYGAISNSGAISAEANASANWYSAYADAYGIHASDVYGSLTNSSTGTIAATAHATAGEWSDADAFAAGIDIGELFGTLTNAGTISAEAHALATYTGVAGAASAEALGIAMNYMAASGTLDNSGTISAHATATGNGYMYSGSDSAVAKGIVVENGGSLAGLLTNSGTITAVADANATSGSAQARAYGIEVSSELTGSLTNTSTGTISAKATAAANYNSYTNSRADASATGFSVNYFSGTLANAGTIKAEAEAYAQSSTAEANAYGLLTGTITGALTNGGTISATATASATGSGSAYASAIGVDISGSLTGRLDNSGTITAEASGYAKTGTADAYAIGIEIESPGEVTGSLTNTGTISAKAVASMTSSYDALATAYGIHLDSGNLHGNLVNKGTIEATAQATCAGNSCSSVSAEAYGIDINGDLTGSLDNSGAITATATATSTNGYGYGSYTGAASASAFGVTVSDLSGALTNSGTITATATAKAYSDTSYGADARAVGIIAGDIESLGSLTNSGTISATASAFNSNESANASASGVRMSYVSGTVNNSGTIIANADAESLGAVILTPDGIGPAGQGFSSSSVNAGALGMGMSSLLRTGTVTNSGTIKAAAQATGMSNDASAYAIGLDVGENSFGPRAFAPSSDRNVSGSLINTASGKIEANATANSLSGSAYAYAVGLNLGDITITGSVINNGTISASADASAESGQEASATAFGIRADSILGSLTNSGTIKATAVAQALGTSSAEATAYGLAVGNIETTGTVTNSGTIEAIAQSTGLTSYNSASAYGLAVSNIAGTVTNSGTISATAIANNQSSWAGAYASGITLSDVLSTGIINNSGTITAIATAISTAPGTAAYPYVSASADGISMSEMAGSLTNSGAISATATATANNIEMTSAYAEAYGLDVYGELSGTLTNSGNISAVAKATNLGMGAWAAAYGVRVEQSSSLPTYTSVIPVGGNLSGTLTNSGVISAVAEAEAGSSASAYAVGVLVEGALTGTINNSGTISGFVAGDHPERGYSLRIADGSGTVNNEAGGLLYGNLYTGGTVLVDNQGTISLPNRPTAFDAAMIMGDYNQGSTGKLEIGAASTVNYGQLTVDGTATLATGSGLAVDVAYGNTLVSGDTLADVVAAGTLNATTLAVTDNNGLLDFTAVIDGNTIDLGVTRNSATSLIEGAGTTGSSGAAALFDRLLASNWQGGGMDDALSVIWNDLQTAQQVSDAIGSTVPILNGDMPRAIAGAKHGINRIVRTRQAGEGMNSGDGFFTDRNIWLKPFASTATQDDNNGAPGFDADSYGLMLGADGKFGDNFRLGFAFAYSSTDVDGNGGAPREAKVKSYQGNVYGTFDLSKGTELNWQADYGAHSNEITRNMPLFGRVASADYDSWSAHAGVEVAKDLAIGPKTSLTPSVRVDYTMITDDGYTETGAGSLNLTVDENETDELIFGIDGKLTHDLGVASITANLGVGYDALAGDDSITASFAGAPSAAFETVGVDPSPWLYGGGLGVSLGSRDKMEFTVRYDVEARQDFLDQSVSLKLQKSF